MNGGYIAAMSLAFTMICALLGYIIRAVRKQTHIEDKLDTVIRDLGRLVMDKDRTHAAMLEQMKADRDATNTRLRFIEEWFMKNASRR